MTRILLIILAATLLAGCANMEVSFSYPGVAGATIKMPVRYPDNYHEAGIASYYADKYQGRLTANGERFDMYAISAAHKTLPFDTRVRVTNINNGRSLIVRINDRGPFIEGRIIDLSYAAFSRIENPNEGLADVVIEILN